MNPIFRNLTGYLFFSNIFLGIISVALCIETNLVNGISFNYFPFYAIIFLGTCLFYSAIYAKNSNAFYPTIRTLWYKERRAFIHKYITLIFICLIVFTAILVAKTWKQLFYLSGIQWSAIFFFPILGLWYSLPSRWLKLRSIRQLGMIKPFVIGLTWSGFVVVYPIITWQLQTGKSIEPVVFQYCLFWLQDFLFLSILAIIFDTKDIQSDRHHGLQTFPAVFGITRTMQWIALPLLLFNTIVLACFQQQMQYSFAQKALQYLPYCILLMVILQHHRPKSLLYYLAAVDGLLLVKALCGIISIIFLNKP